MDSAFEKCPMKLKVTSDAQLFIFANFVCIKEVQDLVFKMIDKKSDMMQYYKNIIQEQVFNYVYEGSEYMLKTQDL